MPESSQSPARVLLVEDERNLAAGIALNLEAEGHEVELSGDGEHALESAAESEFDLLILDVMLPRLDGFSVCEALRERGSSVPILFLTAKSSVDDRIRGLEAGGDDYLAKPFHLQELLLRVRAILKRRGWYSELPAAGRRLRFGDNEFDLKSFVGRSWDGKEHHLTQKEAMILKALAEREGEVVSREEILDKVWGYDVFPSSRTIDNFIVRLRRRFEPDPDRPRFIHTVRGIGYRFSSEGEAESPS